MRLLRLCESEGGLDFGSFLALRESVSLGEALEIEAALCVIGDQRAEFADFFQANQGKSTAEKVKPGAVEGSAASLDGLKLELVDRERRLDVGARRLMAHRQAVAMPDSDQSGRLSVKAARSLQESLDAQRNSIAYVSKLMEKAT
jgi:hypothetical protein